MIVGRNLSRTALRTLVLAAALVLGSAQGWSQAALKAVPDQTSYNVGSQVRIRLAQPAPGTDAERPTAVPRELVATIRYAGESRPVAKDLPLPDSLLLSSAKDPSEYFDLWRVPRDARTGRYEIDIAERDPRPHQSIGNPVRTGSFAVYRKVVHLEEIKLDKTFYTTGDQVAAVVALKNLADHPLSGLRVEFSKRYWPWIAQTSERADVDAVTLADSLSLPAGGAKEIRSARAAVAADVKQPTVSQYAVVVWDRERKNVLDIAFTPIVFVRPPGVDSPRPYAGPPGLPMQYLHPDLSSINTSSYRRFYPPELDSPAIQFEHSHTMFASGSEATVNFSVRNPTSAPWRGVSVRARLLGPDGAELASNAVADALDLGPGATVDKSVPFRFPAESAGVYRAEVQVSESSGAILATNTLELAVNPLPKSILIFCAHPDDEGAHHGVIRAAVENHIPIHFVYFTSGDAGSCDRYYQHSCAPAEGLNFGALRMDEARAALGHLGVPPEDIYFLGLPDGGSGHVWYDHVKASDPYLSVMLASDRAPYEGLARPNLPYAREPVVEMAKELIERFRPEVIYTGHPDERHVDHRTNNWFVVKAMQELLRQGSIPSSTILLTDQSYGPGPQVHAPYRYQKNVFFVSGEATALGQEAGWYYQSQDGNRAEGSLRAFDRLRRTEVHWQVLDWKDHEGWNETGAH